MLEIDEQHTTVRSFRKTGYFLIDRSHQEAFQFVRLGSGAKMRHDLRLAVVEFQRLSVSEPSRRGGKHHRVRPIGHCSVVGPDPADIRTASESDTIGAGKVLVRGEIGQVNQAGVRIGLGAKQVDIPAKACRIRAVLRQTQDVPVHVAALYSRILPAILICARVRGIDAEDAIPIA